MEHTSSLKSIISSYLRIILVLLAIYLWNGSVTFRFLFCWGSLAQYTTHPHSGRASSSVSECAERQFSKIITTPNTPPRRHCLADEAEGEGNGVSKYVSRSEPYWARVASSSERWRSNMCLTSSSSGCHYGGVEEDASNNLCSSGEFHAQED